MDQVRCASCGRIVPPQNQKSMVDGVCGVCWKDRGQRRCNPCELLKPLSEFPGGGKNSYWCKQCILDNVTTGRRNRCGVCTAILIDSHCNKCLHKEDKRYCAGCKEIKPFGAFYAATKYCKECSISQSILLNKTRPRKKSASLPQKLRRIKYAFGISKEDYDKLVGGQDNKCAVCAVELTEETIPSIDHCHETMLVRGLLCRLCNNGLGNFRDSPELLSKAVQYLADPPATKLMGERKARFASKPKLLRTGPAVA